MMDVDTALRARGPARASLPCPIARATVEALLDEARPAPSGHPIQPWPVRVVAAATRAAMSSAVGGFTRCRDSGAGA